ncbi:MAG: hypothetical protein E7418_01375 [Ruminococcaceae bacterium]|nr:hypothetical protein [Oscillospiraceae bacterium]
MNTYELLISSPDGQIFKGEVCALSVRGVEGELAVMAGHIPLVTPIVACTCKIEQADGTILQGTTEGGLLTVGKETVTLLSGSFAWIEE